MYAGTRLFTFVAVSIAQRSQIALPAPNGILRIMYPTDKAPGYLVVMANWDGQWYRWIAENGYPAELPYTFEGKPDMNPWAFFPLFPMAVRVLMWVTHLDFYVVASTFSLLVGAVAMVLLFRLVDDAVGRWPAMVAVVGTCTFISAPILQAAYTESLALLFVVVTLLLLRQRRYWWVAVTLVFLGLTRNVVVAMVPVVLAHAFVRWQKSDDEPFPVAQRWALGALAAEAAFLTFLWPGIVALVTREADGYAKTMQAWRINASEIKLGSWWAYLWYGYGWVGVLFGIMAVAVFAWFMLTHRTWHWGPEIWGWAGAYPAYQLLVTNSGPSRLRYALLAFPFALLIAWFLNLPRWRRWRVLGLVGVALLGLGQQVWWIQNYLVVSHLDGTIYFP